MSRFGVFAFKIQRAKIMYKVAQNRQFLLSSLMKNVQNNGCSYNYVWLPGGMCAIGIGLGCLIGLPSYSLVLGFPVL